MSAAVDSTAEAEVTRDEKTYRDFSLDNVPHSPDEGDIHFNLHVPESYDGTKAAVRLFSHDEQVMGWLFRG